MRYQAELGNEIIPNPKAFVFIKIWAYCLMTNHAHIIVTPSKNPNLSKSITLIQK